MLTSGNIYVSNPVEYFYSRIWLCRIFSTCSCLHKHHHCKPTLSREIQTINVPVFW